MMTTTTIQVQAAESPHDQPQPATTTTAAVTVEAFALMIPQLQGSLINFLWSRLSNRQEAEDAAQDTLLKAYRGLSQGTIVKQPAFYAWLYRIASNTATDILRRRKLITWIPISTLVEDRGVSMLEYGRPTENGENQQARRAAACSLENVSREGYEEQIVNLACAQEILTHIPQIYATCLMLYAYGYSYEEMAALLHLKLDAVKMRMKRARDRCNALLMMQSMSDTRPAVTASARRRKSDIQLSVTAAQGREAATATTTPHPGKEEQQP